MRIRTKSSGRFPGRPCQRGLALLVVMVVLAVMALLAIQNTRTLACLQQDLRLIEHKQLRKFELIPAPGQPAPALPRPKKK